MASTLNRSRPNNGASSSDLLSDSTYDMMSDSILASDEEDAESVASLDDHDMSDIRSIDDMDSLAEGLQEDLQSDSGGIPSYEGLDDNNNIDRMHSSARTVLHVEEEPVPPQGEILFDEPDHIGDQVSAVFILCEVSDDETIRIGSHLQTESVPSGLVFAVNQTMSKKPVNISDTFRILYVGEESAKETIISKIGAALVASSESDLDSKEASPSRYNIVPITSFGGGTDSSPDVELVPVGIGMEVHTCSHAGRAESEEGSDTISLVLQPRAVVRSSRSPSGSRQLEAGNWKLPHLVVYYCTEHDDAETRQTRDLTKAFMNRHAVPGIVISDKTSYHEKPLHDVASIHMTLESLPSAEAEGVIYKRIPVSLQTFLAVDNRQMNRNIAYITGLCKPQPPATEKSSAATPGKSSTKPKGAYDGGIFGGLKDFNDIVPKEMWTFVLIGWFLFCGILTGCLLKMRLSAQTNPMVAQAPAGSTNGVQATTPLPQLTSKASSVASSSSVTSSSSSSTSYCQVTSPVSASQLSAAAAVAAAAAAEKTKALSKVYELANSALSLSDASAPTPQTGDQQPEKFLLHSIGDGHIVIRPPPSFQRQRKQPRLHVSVTKDGKALDVHLSEIFKGIYDLAIHRDDAWGIITVDIHTKSKPIVKESFTMDLGSQWLKVNSWKKVAWRTSSRVQKYLSTASDEAVRRAKQLEVPKVAGEVNKVLTENAEKVRNKVIEAGGKVAEVGDSLYKDRISKPLAGLLKDIKKGNLQNSVGEKVSRAQKRANRLWKRGQGVAKEEPKCPRNRRCGAKQRSGSKKARKFKR